MALPLLMMAGAGILGGTQYLMKKQDDEKVQSLLPDFSSAMASSPFAGTPGGMMMEQEAQRIAGDDSFFSSNKSGKMDSLFGQLKAATFQQQQAAAANQIASGRYAQEQAMAYENDLQADSKFARERWGGIQNTTKQMVDLIDTGQANAFESTRLIYQYLDLLAPGEIKTESDINAVAQAGGALGNLAQKYLTAIGDPNVVNETFLKGLRRDVLSIAGQENQRWGRVDDNIRQRLRNNPYSDYTRYENVVGTQYGINPEYQLPEQQQVPVQSKKASPQAALTVQLEQLKMENERLKGQMDSGSYRDPFVDIPQR